MNRFKWLSLLCAVYLLCMAAPRASAQLENFAQEGEPPQAGIELLQSDPHDIIRFTEKAGGGWPKSFRSTSLIARCLRTPKAIFPWSLRAARAEVFGEMA